MEREQMTREEATEKFEALVGKVVEIDGKEAAIALLMAEVAKYRRLSAVLGIPDEEFEQFSTTQLVRAKIAELEAADDGA